MLNRGQQVTRKILYALRLESVLHGLENSISRDGASWWRTWVAKTVDQTLDTVNHRAAPEEDQPNLSYNSPCKCNYAHRLHLETDTSQQI